MTRRWPALPPARTRARWAALLVAALLWAQWLGAWHQTLHASGAARHGAAFQALERIDRAHQAVASTAGPGSATDAGAGHVFHHVAGGIECRLLDQLLLGDAAPTSQAQLVALQRAVAPPAPAAGPLLSVALLRAYLARAPPAC